MKKHILVLPVFVIVITLIFTGCVYTKKDHTDTASETQPTNTQDNKLSNSEDTQNTPNVLNSTPYEDILKMIEVGDAVKCTSGSVENALKGEGTSVSIEFEKERFRYQFIYERTIMRSVYDGDTYYTWEDNLRKGQKMTKECLMSLQESPEDLPEPTKEQPSQETDIYELVKAYNDLTCEKAGEAINFEVPGDVEFSDACDMINNLNQQQEDLQRQLEDKLQQMEELQGVRPF